MWVKSGEYGERRLEIKIMAGMRDKRAGRGRERERHGETERWRERETLRQLDQLT